MDNKITAIAATVSTTNVKRKRFLSIQDAKSNPLTLSVDRFEDAVKLAINYSSVLYVIDFDKRLMYAVKELKDINNPTEEEAAEIPEDCLGFYLSYDAMEFADFETEEDIAEFRKKYGDDPILTVNFIYAEDFDSATFKSPQYCWFFV